MTEALRVFSEVNDLLLRSSSVEARRLIVVAQVLLLTGARLKHLDGFDVGAGVTRGIIRCPRNGVRWRREGGA